MPRHHRTVEEYVNGLIDAGLVVRRLLEPVPTPAQAERSPRLADQRRRPSFLLVRADKPG